MNENFEALRKYNLWDSNTFDCGYIRNEYTNKIVGSIGNRLVKVLVGQRRSGKSYILRQVAKQLIEEGVRPENTLFINREFTDFDFLKTYKELDELIKSYKRELKPEGKVYVFIDEVQLIEGWEKVVNSYSQDFSESYELFISGSNSKMLSGELATLLSGRYVCFQVFPFSYFYLQSAYMLGDESTVEREYSALEAIGDNFEKVVVSLDDVALPLRKGIKHIQAWSLKDIL